MKKDIHPKYFAETEISCSCGNVVKVGATKENMSTEICSACHPFYTGKKKLVDSTGQVDRFKKMMEKTEEMKKKAAAQKKDKETKAKKKSTKKAEKKSEK